MKNKTENFKLLCKAVVSLETEDEAKAFLEDLCTPQELDAMSQRMRVASMLADGCVYNKIVEDTGASTATVSRVNKTLTYQTAGGYKAVFDRIKGGEK